jgi:hypothetical protein
MKCFCEPTQAFPKNHSNSFFHRNQTRAHPPTQVAELLQESHTDIYYALRQINTPRRPVSPVAESFESSVVAAVRSGAACAYAC